MGVFSRIEGGLDSAFDKAAGTVFRGPIEPAQIAKRAEKQMNREKLVGAGRQYAPTLYTVLVNRSDDNKLFAFYPTMAAEIETYLMGKGSQNGLKFDGRPLVRFIVDKKLKSGKFEVIAENVAAPIILKLRDEEAEYYGLKTPEPKRGVPATLSPENLLAENLFALPDTHQDDLFIDTGRGENDYMRSPRSSISMEYPDGLGASALAGAGYAGMGASALAGAGHAGLGADLFPVGRAFGNAAEPTGSAYARSNLASIPTTSTSSQVIGHARLTNINAGSHYALTKTVIIIGRDESCAITIRDANISRHHAQLTQDATGVWKLTDLGSTNGSSLNGSNVKTAFLRDGDELTFGITTLVFREN